MLTVLIYVLILWGIIALAWLGAWWLRRRGPDTSGQFTNTAVFVGFLFGFLLTTLQVFATNHYSDTRSQAQSEPTSLVTMYDDLGVFPPHVSATGRRDVICYMWSVAEGDWKAQEQGDTQESRDTVVWGDRLRSFRNTLPQDSPATQAGYSRVSTDLTDADTARQQLLFLAQPQIPAILWVVVFVSGGLLIFLQVSDSQSQGKIARRSMLTAVIVLMTLEVASLAVLDRPFSPVARIQPTAMTNRHRTARGRPHRATYPAGLCSVGDDQPVARGTCAAPLPPVACRSPAPGCPVSCGSPGGWRAWDPRHTRCGRRRHGPRAARSGRWRLSVRRARAPGRPAGRARSARR